MTGTDEHTGYVKRTPMGARNGTTQTRPGQANQTTINHGLWAVWKLHTGTFIQRKQDETGGGGGCEKEKECGRGEESGWEAEEKKNKWCGV